MECLRGQEGELIVKELSLCNGDCQQQYIFRPPYILRNPDSKFKNKWLRKNINGFSWYDGYLDYSQLERFVRQFGRRYKRLFTKGDEKAMLLTNLCGMPVEDLGKYGAPKQKTIKLPTKRCQFHLNKPQLQCAVDKSIKFYGWICQQEQQEQEQQQNQQQEQRRVPPSPPVGRTPKQNQRAVPRGNWLCR